MTVSWASSTGATGYILEGKCGTGEYIQLYDGSSITYNNSITGCTTSVQYRVKAYNTVATVASPYRESENKNLIVPTAPNTHNGTYMQNFTTAMCNGYQPPSDLGYTLVASTMYDTRDGKGYEVRKFADGKCWMVDNLAIDATMTFNSGTSDLASGTFSSGSMMTINNSSYCANLNTTDYRHKCGNIYNRATATAGSALDSNNNALGSICPKNWRLPTSTEYLTMTTALGWGSNGVNAVNSAWRGLYTGYYNGNDIGNRGNYWSASYVSGGHLNYASLVFNSSSASILWDYDRYYYAVRCLAR